MSIRKLFNYFFIFLIVLFLSSSVYSISDKEAIIYYNEACSDCTVYIDELILLLNENGITNIIKKDYINDRNNRVELNALNEELAIPVKMQGHFSIFIGDKIILNGHVPRHIIEDLFKEENQEKFDKMVVLQSEMHDNAKNYYVWAFKGEIKEYPIDTPITDYLNWFDENKDKLKTPDNLKQGLNPKTFLPLLLITGLFDGLNPCAFAVLLFFIAFLYTIHRTKTHIIKVGIIYILMIYLAYLSIGLGILKAIMITGTPHFMAKLASWLVIGLGLINIKDYFWYGKGFSLKMPKVSRELINKFVHKATIPATIVIGFLVGLCTFPCSGGPYVAILGLLAAKTTYYIGLLYLLIYNAMFVIPLIVILTFFSNKRVIGKISKWEEAEKKPIKLAMGLLMIALGVIILIFFV